MLFRSEKMSRRGVQRTESTTNISASEAEDFKLAFKIYCGDDDELTAPVLQSMLDSRGVKGNAEKMLAEAGGKSMDSLTFQAMMSRKMGQGETKEAVQKAFATFDWKRTGKINRNDLEHALTTMGEPLTRAELQAAIEASGGADEFFHWNKFLEALFPTSSH